MITEKRVIHETEAEFHQRIGAPDRTERIEGTILVDRITNGRGLVASTQGTVFCGTTLAPESSGYDDGMYVEVDVTGQIVYACHRDGDGGPRRWWFAGIGTCVDEASLW